MLMLILFLVFNRFGRDDHVCDSSKCRPRFVNVLVFLRGTYVSIERLRTRPGSDDVDFGLVFSFQSF
jgi:hypothetical protein